MFKYGNGGDGKDTGVLEKKVKTYQYSPLRLKSYDANRHIKVSYSYDIIAKDGLPREKLDDAIEQKQINVYKFKGEKYFDRLDIGRVFHEKNEEKKGLTIEPYFTSGIADIFATAGEYGKRDVRIWNDKRTEVIFEMKDAVFPESWDDNDAGIVAQKYFYKPNEPEWKKQLSEKIGKEHESDIRQLTKRVTNFFVDAGKKLGYFATEEDAETFRKELLFLQTNRMFAFNSPVQFNAGLFTEYGVNGSPGINYWKNPETGEVDKIEDGCNIKPQCHACFINGPRDSLEEILNHAVNEGGIFSSGSGIGQDIGALRAAGELLSSGGKASGPMSFFKVYDTVASTIKSGGKSRRAARMTVMPQSHPDILEFIRCKVREDRKALILMENGYGRGMDGEAFATVAYQNTNISVRLDDEFFKQLENKGEIELKKVTDGSVVSRLPADNLLKEISFGSWRVGDPGVQYESKIHEMHTAKNSGRQKATNPCSEYMFLNDTSCNLASLNLLSFSDIKGNFDVEKYMHAARIVSIAQDIANDAASYPVEAIAQISPEFRTIGLGFANLGALLMRRGLAYDSDEGRAFAAALTAIITGKAYETSAELAEKLEPFVHFEFNKKPMLEVMEKHKENLDRVDWKLVPNELKEEAYKLWEKTISHGREHGFRNAQATVLAPTGTISYLMGCETTGVEPAISLKIYKDLAGGGTLTLTSKELPNALHNLGYETSQVKDIASYFEKHETIFGAPHLKAEHYKIFNTAFGDSEGRGSIDFEGHVKMLGAVQPYISGAISKTNNLPESASVKDIYDGFLLGYNLGLKAMAVFRNNSKPVSALNFGGEDGKALRRGEKEDLPSQRTAYESEVMIGGQPLHITVSEYPDGRPGQIVFLSYKAGSTLKALLETHGIIASKALKRGVPLEVVLSSWEGQEFEPKGLVHGDPFIKQALSPIDYAAKVIRLHYLGDMEVANVKEGLTREKLRGFENGAFRTYKKMKIDDWDIEQVLKDPELGGFVDGKEKAEQGKENKNLNNNRGVTCRNCGSVMRQTSPNCWECRCGDKTGGCGM